MKKNITSILAAGALSSALFMGSSTLMADNHGDKSRGDRYDMTEMCENLREGKGKFNKEERQARMEERRAAMADRLKLNDEQREIWHQIHEEKREKHEKRMEKWQEKLEKRCAKSKG
ncbi:hypothetical protein [Marinobacter sp.]|uniref:hypothetical protein n=1 Tax=Marinobacter sp. TaxID=50741 RepID=UPI0035661EB9